MKLAALLDAEVFGFFNTLVVIHLLHDAVTCFIFLAQEKLFAGFHIFLIHRLGAFAEDDLIHPLAGVSRGK